MKKTYFYLSVLSLSIMALFNACTEDEPVPPASVVAKFSFVSNNNFIAPSQITFTNESVVPSEAGTATYAWDFGNGDVSSDKNPVYTYTESGTFTVKLKVSSTNASPAEFTLDITIQSGELFSENFESFADGDNLPANWVIIDNDGGIADDDFYDKAWKIAESSKMGGKIAAANSYYTTPVDADDWMILPAIAVENKTFLSWQAMSLTSSGNYRDSYEVYVSTTTQDIAGCLAGVMLKQVLEEQAATTATSAPGAGIQSYEVDLSQFAGKSVYIAFRLMTPADEGSELGVDNIRVFKK